MNAAVSTVILQGFLKGGFDVLDALLGGSFAYDAGEPEAASHEALHAALAEFPVAMRAAVSGGGGVALLFRAEDATRIVSLTKTGEPGSAAAIAQEDLGTLREIAESVLGGGAENLGTKFGQAFALEHIDSGTMDAADAPILQELLGTGAVLARFEYSWAPHFKSEAAMAYSAALESRVPKKLIDTVFGGEMETTHVGSEPLVSDQELSDILSGFDPGGAAPEAASRGGKANAAERENLDVILGIELTVTARLGRIEMPISEVLALGPGSILEVGRMVDEPVDLYVNDHLIARGDVVVVEEKFGIRITEVISRAERIESLR